MPSDSDEKRVITDETEQKLENDFFVVSVSKPNFSCHIEYVLLPKLGPIYIDVVSWDKVAKIYFENTSSAIQPKKIKKLRWIHFRVKHTLNLSLEDIQTLINHNLKITVSLGNKETARYDSVQKFYYVKVSVDHDSPDKQPEIFQPMYESLDDLKSSDFNKKIKLTKNISQVGNIFVLLETSIEKNKNFDILYEKLVKFANEYDGKPIERVSTQTIPNEEVFSEKKSKDFSVGPSALTLGRNSSKAPESVQEENRDAIEFFVTGDDLLSGKGIFQNCVKYRSQDLPFVISLIEIRNILTKFQANFLSPLSITIKNCKYLPVDELKKYGMTVIKFQYDVFDKISVESSTLPVDNVIKINFTKTFFTNNLDHSQLINYLQTAGLKINVLGNFQNEKFACKKNALGQLAFNNNKNNNKNKVLDRHVSENPTNYEMVTMGTAFIDLSSVLRQPHILLCKCNFIPFEKSQIAKTENQDNFLTNELNPCHWKKNDFKSPTFLVSQPLLTVMIRMNNSVMTKYTRILRNPNVCNRLFTVIYNTKIAIPIIQIIQNETKEVLEPVNYCKNGLNLKRPLTKKHLGPLLNDDFNKRNKMTGFIIDCVSKIIIFVEGSQFGKIQQIWALISRAKPTEAHVLYDSTLIFTKRLCKNFYKYGGFFKVTLEEDLEIILSRIKSCRKQDVPELAYKAIHCLYQLIHCKSIKTAIQSNLFPETDSLSSLAIEFGIPIQFYEKQYNVN